MHFLIVFLGVVVGIFLFLGIVALILYYKAKRALKELGYTSMKKIAREIKDARIVERDRVKNISGMTRFVVPKLRDDFPDFNENELYNIIEKDLRIVFSAIENKNVKELKTVPLLKPIIEKIIEDYEDNGMSETYDDIKFHKHSIHSYEKKNGMATIITNTALEYYYKKEQNNKIIINNMSYKKQTSYACKFIYIYDESKLKDSSKAISINCPNCNAPIRTLGDKHCEYCGSKIKEINLKAWMISSYEEI